MIEYENQVIVCPVCNSSNVKKMDSTTIKPQKADKDINVINVIINQ